MSAKYALRFRNRSGAKGTRVSPVGSGGGTAGARQLPERWTFRTEVPKTSVGKFDGKRLRSQCADGELTVTTIILDPDLPELSGGPALTS
ncbi:hypothetical protein [Nocardia sp. NBC_00403]|uniref:hypothetical protein n=1 Tax=Nocardia sp. NBC_00403 TaxID=2975990 RepID=UPI002E1A2E7D